jgi:hypothetical protein
MEILKDCYLFILKARPSIRMDICQTLLHESGVSWVVSKKEGIRSRIMFLKP